MADSENSMATLAVDHAFDDAARDCLPPFAYWATPEAFLPWAMARSSASNGMRDFAIQV
jgi:hypothetical protein